MNPGKRDYFEISQNTIRIWFGWRRSFHNVIDTKYIEIVTKKYQIYVKLRIQIGLSKAQNLIQQILFGIRIRRLLSSNEK